MIGKNFHLSAVSLQLKKIFSFSCAIILLFMVCSLSTAYGSSEEAPVIINADSLEYDKETSVYHAKGSVKVQQGNVIIEAKEMRYDEKTSEITAQEDVKYSDPDITLKAARVEYNIKSKTGMFYDAEIFSKKDNFHVSGAQIEKRGEKEYFLTKASLTTCDAPLPAWCMEGKDVDLVIGDRLKAKKASFKIRGVPVLYTPYFFTPVLNERKTGFLMPIIGYTKTKGFNLSQPFYWAIDEDKDATLILDWYSKRGFGEGLEYRYVAPGNVKGTDWLYHLRDGHLDKDFYEVRALHEKRSPDDLSAYLNLNYVQGTDFYREYGKHHDDRVARFLESTGEVSLPAADSRFYLMSRYLIDLKEDSHNGEVVQTLPEAGYVMNPRRVGPMVFSLTSSAANFWRKEDVYGRRLDIYPKISYSTGDKVVIFQNLGLRETAYSLDRNEDTDFKSSISRELFDYNITASSRLVKEYESFTHAVEPSIGYTFIPKTSEDKTNLPLFDSTELYSRRSAVELAVTNRFIDKEGEFLTVRASGAYDSYAGDDKFSPIKLEAAIKRPVYVRGDISYDANNGYVESVNSDIKVNLYKAAVSIGERYNRKDDIAFYDVGVKYTHSKNLSTEIEVWYDAKGGGVEDVRLKLKYQKQCWGVTVALDRRPGDYGVYVNFDLLGLGSVKI